MTQRMTKGGVGAPSSLLFPAKTVAACVRDFDARTALRGIFCAVLAAAGAAEGIRYGLVERPMTLAAGFEDIDPVVAQVGTDVLRVSDAVAHAMFTGTDAEDATDVPKLIASGTVDEAVDHLALAQLARESGLDGTLEIRAAVALAERQILAEAYLDQISEFAASEEQIRARYDAEREAMAAESVMRLSKIVLPTQEAAQAVLVRLPRANFSTLASQKSIDTASAELGGLMGDLTSAELEPGVADALAGMAIGGVTDPILTEEGWTIVKLESRRALRLPRFEERRDEIARTLREEAIQDALGNARDRFAARVRPAEVIVAESEQPDAVLASVRPAL